MPFYPEMGIIFIHIPKTGGTSVETYFEDIMNIPIDSEHMYNFPLLLGHRRQHCTYAELSEHIPNINKYKIFSIVRNPTHRIVSEVLYLKKYWKIDVPGSTLDDKIKHLLLKENINSYDNHLLPQYKYLTNKDGIINKQIHVMHNEMLDQDMQNYGFVNFGDIKELVSDKFTKDYDSMIADDTKQLIKEFYRHDFELFYPELL